MKRGDPVVFVGLAYAALDRLGLAVTATWCDRGTRGLFLEGNEHVARVLLSRGVAVWTSRRALAREEETR